ncbi:MAG: alpha/beta hydrolase [Pseudomonadota bacterium]
MELVYLHGAGLSAASWGDVPGRALDLPGHGGAPRVRPVRAETYADAIETEVPQDAVLIGLSLGGMVAMAFAARYPERLRALVLVDVPIRAPLRFISWYTPFVAPIVTRVPGTAAIGRAVGKRIGNPEGRAAFAAHLAGADPSGMADALVVAGAFNGEAVLPRLTMPLLALCATKSLLTGPKYQAKLRAACPHVEIVRMEMGHLIPFEDQPAMQAEIDRFVAALDKAQR